MSLDYPSAIINLLFNLLHRGRTEILKTLGFVDDDHHHIVCLLHA